MGRKKKSETIYIPEFNPIPHEYVNPKDGTILDSVTYILKRELDLYKGMPSGPGSAAQRGTTIHAICQYYDEGDLAEETVSPEFLPWFEQYKKAKEELKIEVIASEFRRFCPTHRFAGTVDRLVRINGNLGVLDIKTCGNEIFEAKHNKYQLAAYVKLIEHEHPGEDLCRWNLYLSPTEYRLVEHTNPVDYQHWLVLMTAYKIKMNEGFLKKE